MLNALLIGVDEKDHKFLCWNWFFVCLPWSSFSWCHWSRLILFMLKIYFESFSRFINTLPCFGWFSLIRARNWAPFLLLDSLFFEESAAKISEFFSTFWTGWEPFQQVLHAQPCFINALPCFGRFSLIRAQNWAPFLLLDSLFFEESSVKISEFFSIGWTGWEPVQQVLHVQPCFINALPCFDRFSLIQARNRVPFLLLDSLFFQGICY